MKKNFITGIVFLLPIVVTLAILFFIINFLTKPFLGPVSNLVSHFPFLADGVWFMSRHQVVTFLSQTAILILLFLTIVIIGMITRWFFISTLIKFSDKMLHKIPIINTVYKTTQDIITTLFSSSQDSFKKVVMVPFPKENAWMLGLISGNSPQICSHSTGKHLLTVLIPTTPNPTTGFLLMYPKEDVIELDMTIEEAVKYTVSCGVIIPPHEVKNKIDGKKG